MKNISMGRTITIRKPAELERKSITLPKPAILVTYLPTISPSAMICVSLT